MEQPPFTGNPYDYVNPSAPNPGAQGVRVAWDATRQFYGQVLNQAWDDLQAIQGSGTGVLV